jgi:DNA-binding response OmpR family regulator
MRPISPENPVPPANDGTKSSAKTHHSADRRQCARILCLDDDSCIRLICEQALTRLGYDVDVAEDGSAGWTAMQKEKYDLLITDNDMPGLTGVELVRRMRLAQIQVPVVLMSGALGAGLHDELFRLEGTTILQKPFTPAQLLASIDEEWRAAATRSNAR